MFGVFKIIGLLLVLALPFLRPTGDETRRVVFHLYSASYFGLAVLWAILAGLFGGLWLAGGPQCRQRLWKGVLLLASFGLMLVCVEVFLHRCPRFVPPEVKARLAGGGMFLDFHDTAHTLGVDGVRFRFAPNQRETLLCAVSNRLSTIKPLRGPVPAGHATYEYQTDYQGFCNATDVTGHIDLLVIGDSFAEMGHLPDASRWHVRLAKACGWTHRCLGIGGIGPTEGFRILNAFGAPHHPRLMVFSIFEGNDPWDDDTWLRWQASGRSYADYLMHNEVLQNRIILFKWYEYALERTFAPRGGAAGGGSGERGEPRPEFMAAFSGRLTLPAEAIQSLPGWSAVLKAVDDAQAWCATNGAQMAVVLWPSREHVYALHYAETGDAQGLAEVRGQGAEGRGQRSEDGEVGRGRPAPPMVEGGGWGADVERNADTVHRLLAAHCAERGIAFEWVMEPLLESLRHGKAPYYLDDIHPNEEGNAVVGDYLSGRLKALLIQGNGR